VFGHHANAVALAKTTNEVFFAPGELEPVVFGLEHFRHVAPDHPTDVDSQLLLLKAHARPPSLSAQPHETECLADAGSRGLPGHLIMM
jgi:hypothetical protein